MNNEEKIIEILEQHGKILEQHGALLQKMSDRMDRMDQRMDRMDQRMDHMDQRMDDMYEVLMKTALKQENEVLPQLRFLYENQVSINDKRLDSRVEALEGDMDHQKYTVSLLVDEVKQLKQAQ